MNKHKSVDYQSYLLESLRDPEEASLYLNEALEEDDIKVFLLALKNIVQANGGVAKLSEQADKSRTSLYKTLSDKGNPYLKNIKELLSALNLHISVQPNHK
tara:strand:+ start:5683 stop:5985 length:303 start_codon:yes stop_codon:yes gene_type:complete